MLCYCTATGANNDRDPSQFMVTRQIVFKVCLSVCVYVRTHVSVYVCMYVCASLNMSVLITVVDLYGFYKRVLYGATL